jgi:hypothetical protein
MGFDDYVSENEAASLASVSVQTLRRFVEAGYLRGETDSDGLRLFSKNDVAGLFGVSRRDLDRRSSSDGKVGSPVIAIPPTPSPAAEKTVPSSESISQPTTPLNARVEIERVETSKRSEVDRGSRSEVRIKREPTAIDAASNDQNGATVHETSAEVLDSTPTDPVTAALATPSTPPTPPESPLTPIHEIELMKLRSAIELQERLLAMREDEGKALRAERDWLRTRIEKLEDKQDRDQLILLTETQMIRRLVSKPEPRRSGFRAALEWLGLTPNADEQVQHDSVHKNVRD